MDLRRETIIRIKMVSTVCQTLDSVLKPAFGPCGRCTLLTTVTGQVLITSLGSSIVQCLNIENPIAQLVTSSMLKFEQYSGDGSKTFVLYLAGIFNHLTNYNDCDSQKITLVSACRYVHQTLFRDVIMPAICQHGIITNFAENPSAAVTVMTNLVYTQLSGQYTTTISSYLSRIIVDFVCLELDNFCFLPVAIQNCIDYFHLLCVEAEGRQPLSTSFLKGIIIQKDFLYISCELPQIIPIKLVVLQLTMDRENNETVSQSICEASSATVLHSALEWKTQQCMFLVEWLKKHRVNLVVSSRRICDVLNGLCTAAGMSTVQHVDVEDVRRIEATFNINAVNNLSDLMTDASASLVGRSERCDSMVIGCKRFVYLGPAISQVGEADLVDRSISSLCPGKQLIVYGMSAGACRQVSLNLKNSLKVLRAWSEGGQYVEQKKDLSNMICSHVAVHIRGGGTFEMAVQRAVHKHLSGDRHSSDELKNSLVTFCSSLCSAMTAVPLRLLQNSYRPHEASIARIERLARTCDDVIGVNGRTGGRLESNSTVIEPLATKLHALDSVLQLTIQLLRLDCVLHVKTPITLKDDVAS